MSEEDFNIFLAAINQMKVWEMQERLNIIDNEVDNGRIEEAALLLKRFTRGSDAKE